MTSQEGAQLDAGPPKMEFIPTIYLRSNDREVVGIQGTPLTLKEGSCGKEDTKEKKLTASYVAKEWKENGLGGIIYLLDSKCQKKALEALQYHKGHIIIGGSVDCKNARTFIDSGASHVLVDSYIFSDGQIMLERLLALEKVVGKEHLAVNLSCVRRLHKGRSKFFAWPDRRQEITSFELTEEGIKLIAHHCSRIFCMNFTPNGKEPSSIDTELLIEMSSSPVPVVYGGGIHSSSAIELMEELGAGVLDFTLTDSLDMFGGPFEFSKLAAEHGRFTPTTRISDRPNICTLCRMF